MSPRLPLILGLLLPLTAAAEGLMGQAVGGALIGVDPADLSLVPGEVIVRWKEGVAPVPLTRVAGRRVIAARTLDGRTWRYRLEAGSPRATRAALQELAARPDVAGVEPNRYRSAFLSAPRDPQYDLQWYLKTTRVDRAWERHTGTEGVVVAVIDTGLRPGHPDLDSPRIVMGYDFITDPAEAGDGDGWDADPTDPGTDSLDSSAYHGTHVAGILGATTDNDKGIAAVNWRCKVLVVRALGTNRGRGDDFDIAAAILWAAGVNVTGAPPNPTPAKVINLSFGGPGASATLDNAVKQAQARGVIVVAAAGNQKMDGGDIYPAAIKDVITVGATQYDGLRAPYSNFGPVIDIMAPGGNFEERLPASGGDDEWKKGIVSTLYKTSDGQWGYKAYEGTSQASPIVAGVISLMLAINPRLDGPETLRILKLTADPAALAGSCPQGCGAGLVNAEAAMAVTDGKPIPGATNLPFGSPCATDDGCADGVCRGVGSAALICTRICTSNSTCPGGTTCQGGLCAPTAATAGQGSCTGAECQIEGVGCAVADAPAAGPAAGMPLIALFFGLALAVRRRRSR